MEQVKNQGPMYVLMILLLGGSGLNLNKSEGISQQLRELDTEVGIISEWKAVAEYRIDKLEQRED